MTSLKQILEATERQILGCHVINEDDPFISDDEDDPPIDNSAIKDNTKDSPVWASDSEEDDEDDEPSPVTPVKRRFDTMHEGNRDLLLTPPDSAKRPNFHCEGEQENGIEDDVITVDLTQ